MTGILYGFNHATYDSKFCDDYDKRSPNRRPFYNDPDLVSPRNILIDGNTFFYNNTSPVAGDARWFGLKNNYFYANYISPQSGNYGGGTVAFFLCSDQVEISGNTFIGPSETTPLPVVAGQPLLPFCQTPGLELYSRNLNVHDNTISGQSLDAIAADSLYQGTFQNNHLLQDNGWNVVNPKGANSCLPNPAPSAAFKIGTAASPVIEAKGGCEAVPRDMNGVTVRGNDSNPIDVFHNNLSITTGPAYQAYGVFLEQYGIKSTSKLYGATIDSNNFGGAYPLHNTLYQIYLDYFAGVYGYQGPLNSNSGPNPPEGSVLYLPPENDYPELLPVDAVCASSSTGSACTCNPQQQQNCVCSSPTSACISSQSALWPTPPRCPDRKDSNGNLLQPLPPGSMLGTSRATFKFSGSDKSGAANIAGIYGIFSVGGSDADGSSGPSIDPTGKAPDQGMCNFAYDPVNNLVYLGDGNGGWLAPSTLGSGSDLSTPGGCIIHVSTSSVGTGSGQAAPQTYVVDLFLDVTLPSTPKNKYHIYSFTENSQGQFDRTPDGKTDAIWKYSGYWWNAQTVQ